MSKPILAFILTLAALSSHQVPAFAQTATGSITINTGSQATQLVDSNKNAVTHSYTSDHPFWVNLNECRAGWQYQVSVSTVGTGSVNMEVWATTVGNDCANPVTRWQTCWRVGYFGVNEGTYAYYIPVQNVVAQTNPDNATDATVYAATSADCDRIAVGSPSTGVSITLNFYIFGGTSTGSPTYSANWGDGGYDLRGPTAPGTVNARGADTQLYLDWSQVLDSDLAGYQIYCQPCSTEAGTSFCDSYASVDAGEIECPPTPGDLIPGCLPKSTYLRGTISDKLATSGIADRLDNGIAYGCGITGFDTRQNSGTLSELVTGKPWWVKDFYSTYRKAQGKGGGGFCAIGQRGSGVGLLIPLASLCLLALRRWRVSTRRPSQSSA
jgi:hypothetical protein